MTNIEIREKPTKYLYIKIIKHNNDIKTIITITTTKIV